MQRAYIWLPQQQDDTYAEFKEVFIYRGGEAVLEITADYQFAAYVDGTLAANSQYADLPEYKAVSRYDITHLCKQGENVLTVKAYHPGQEWSQSRKMTACVSFTVLADGQTLCASSERTLCREDPAYSAGDMITGQLGLGYRYDFTAASGQWKPSTVLEPGFVEIPKPIKNTVLTDAPATPAVWGEVRLDGGETAAQRMQRAWQKPVDSMLMGFPVEACATDGVYVLCDLGDERAGYPYFIVECQQATTAYLGWGEHLADGRVRTEIDTRNFAVEIKLAAGKNEFADYLRRIAGRYMCLYVCTDAPVRVLGMGLYEERYPVMKPQKRFDDRLLQRLYEAGRHTLELCMHQHYEDCPWREQALYGMDSRNQMLFGYGAFGEYQFPRANLRLMARCIEEDGLLSLCPPSRNTITIPVFSAYWVLAVSENARADYDEAFVRELMPYVERVMEAFKAQTHGGTVHTLGAKRYWNFQEWSEGLDGGEIFRDYELPSVPDALLTAVCCRAADGAASLAQMLGDSGKADTYRQYALALAAGFEQFYVPEQGLFASYIRDGRPQGFHELTQALLLSTGHLQGQQKEQVLRALQGGEGMVPITLAGMALKYEGLLNCGAGEYVLEDMVRTFAPMLESGSATYWETALGQRDFANAGSLCHGWSAVPCYVLDRLQ